MAIWQVDKISVALEHLLVSLGPVAQIRDVLDDPARAPALQAALILMAKA